MNQNPTLQVQSVIYGNEPESLYKAISNLANAIRVEREQRRFLGQVTLYYGDASPERVLSEAEVEQLLQVYQNSQNENCEKAAAHFIELRAADKLPEPLDPEHKVAKFIGDYYTENRYIL